MILTTTEAVQDAPGSQSCDRSQGASTYIHAHRLHERFRNDLGVNSQRLVNFTALIRAEREFEMPPVIIPTGPSAQGHASGRQDQILGVEIDGLELVLDWLLDPAHTGQIMQRRQQSRLIHAVFSFNLNIAHAQHCPWRS